MSYTIRHIRLFEGAPFKAIKKSNSDNTHSLSNINKINNDIINNISKQIRIIIKAYLFCLKYMIKYGNGFGYTMPNIKLNGRKYDFYKLRDISCLEFNVDYPSKNAESIDDINVGDNIDIKVSGNNINIIIPASLSIGSTIIVSKNNEYSTKGFYIDALDSILHGHADNEFFKSVFSYYKVSFDWQSELEDAIKVSSQMTYNIKYDILALTSSRTFPIKFSLFGIDSFEDIKNDLLNTFKDISGFASYFISNVLCYNSFADSSDLSEMLKIKSIGGKGVLRTQYNLYFYDDCSKLTDNISSFIESTLVVLYCNTLRNGGINICSLNKVIGTGNKSIINIFTPEPRKHGIKNSLIDEIVLSKHTLDLNDVKTRFDKVLCMYKYWGKIYSRLSVEKQEAKFNKFKTSLKAKNNTNNDEYNKYITSLRIEAGISLHENILTVTTVGC